MSREHLIAVARGEAPADLLLAGARVVNTFTAEIEPASVAIAGDRIAGLGDYRQARQTINLGGRYLAPGLINGHIHLESSLLHPAEYARAVVPRGVSSVIADPHEIANVAGLRGVRFMIDCARRLPLDVLFMLPSSVPATRLETSGAEIGAQELKKALRWKSVLGLGELMNFPGVLHRDPGVLEKLEVSQGRIVDGHAPHLRGMDLNAYLAAGARSDHESTNPEEAREKLRRGMHLMIREGSSEKNLEALLPLVTDNTYRRCLLVVDDRTCSDLLSDGDIDAVVRKAIALGLDPVRAIQLATINPAEYFGLGRAGAVAPGYLANLMVLDDLRAFRPSLVLHRGKVVAAEGEPLFSTRLKLDPELTHSVRVKPFGPGRFRLPARGATHPVIEVVPGQIVTGRADERVRIEDGAILPDTKRDILKLVVVERHRATGNIGVGLVRGFGLKRGALASSIAHDSHNIIAAGASDQDIYTAVREIERIQGGLVAAAGKVLGSLPLPIAGLLSDQPLPAVVRGLDDLHRLAQELGCLLPSPFATLSFLALPVIPELKLTDLGLVDVTAFKLLD